MTKKDLRAFLGLANYYSTYIFNATDKLRVLQKMTNDDAVVPTSTQELPKQSEALHAFNTVKYCLTKAPVLVIPNCKGALDGTMPFRVQTDASEAAMGAVFMQDQGLGWQPVAFASNALCDA